MIGRPVCATFLSSRMHQLEGGDLVVGRIEHFNEIHGGLIEGGGEAIDPPPLM